MKDLYNHQKSMNYGVNRLKRRLCRVSSKVKNTNHILMNIFANMYPQMFIILSYLVDSYV